MFYRIRDSIKRKRFNFQCKNILLIPPLTLRGDGLIIVSMVSHDDFLMYLIAIKSFYFYLKKGQIVAISDGILTSKDKAILKYHIPASKLINSDDIKIDKYLPTYIS